MAHEPVPEWIQKELISVGGYADDGKTPFVRFIHPKDAFIVYNGQQIPRYWQTMKRKVVGYSYITGQKFEKFDENGKPVYKPEWRYVKTQAECLGPFLCHYERFYTLKKHWVLEAWMPPSKYARAWEQERYVWEDGMKKDVLGPPPPSGDYTCCVTLNGNFGTPDTLKKGLGREAVEYFKKAWQRMLEDPMWKNSDWRGDPTEEMKELARKEAKEDAEWIDKQDEKRIDEEVRNVMEPNKRYIFGQEKSVSIPSGKKFTGLVNSAGQPISSTSGTV